MSEKLTLVVPDDLNRAIASEANGKYLSRQEFILEAVREKLRRINDEVPA